MSKEDEVVFIICKLPSYNTGKKYYIAVHGKDELSPTYLHLSGEVSPLDDINDLLYSSYDECIKQIESYFDIISETETPRLYAALEAHE